jgi:hypothetical protein
MAITIKNIPVLKDKEADSFVEKAENKTAIKQTVSFKKELSAAKAILEKAKLR